MNLEKYELMIKRGGDRGGGTGGRADRDRVRGGMANPGARGGQTGQAAAAAGRGGRGDTRGGRVGAMASLAERSSNIAETAQSRGISRQEAAAVSDGGRADPRSGGGALAARANLAERSSNVAAVSQEQDITRQEAADATTGGRAATGTPEAQLSSQMALAEKSTQIAATAEEQNISRQQAAAELEGQSGQRAAAGAVSTALFDDTFGPTVESQLAPSTDTGGNERAAVGPRGPQAPADVPGPGRRGNGVVARQIATGDIIRTGGGAGSGAVVREGLRASLTQREPNRGRGRGIGPSRRNSRVSELLRL